MNSARIWKLSKSHLAVIATLVAMLALTLAVYAADGIEGSMRIGRTVKVGANECYRTLTNISADDYIKALGRNADGSWLFIWADVGDGWVPTSSVTLDSDHMALGVWQDHFNGESCAAPPPVDSRICGREGSVTAASTVRWTDIYTTADPDSTTGRAYRPSTAVTILGRDFWGCWVSVSGAGDAGWVPINALSERGVMGLPVLINNSNGCSIDDGAVSCPVP